MSVISWLLEALLGDTVRRWRGELPGWIARLRERSSGSPSFAAATCEILEPRSGNEVKRIIPVSLRIKRMPRDGYLWLAVEDRCQGLLWPKRPEPLPREDGEYTLDVVEEGNFQPAGFAVTVLGVGRAGNFELTKWVESGEETGHFPGLRPDSVTGLKRLATVNKLTLRAR